MSFVSFFGFEHFFSLSMDCSEVFCCDFQEIGIFLLGGVGEIYVFFVLPGCRGKFPIFWCLRGDFLFVTSYDLTEEVGVKMSLVACFLVFGSTTYKYPVSQTLTAWCI